MMDEAFQSDELGDEPTGANDAAGDYEPQRSYAKRSNSKRRPAKPSKVNVPLIVSALLFVGATIALLLPAIQGRCCGADGATRSNAVEMQERMQKIELAVHLAQHE